MTVTKTIQQTAKEILDERIKAFLKKAKLRNGRKFTVDALQRDSREMITTLKGKVEVDPVPPETKSKMIEMYWNTEGKAFAATPSGGQSIQYDLVIEESL